MSSPAVGGGRRQWSEQNEVAAERDEGLWDDAIADHRGVVASHGDERADLRPSILERWNVLRRYLDAQLRSDTQSR